eukprot:GFUD01002948.1.p1 GENE.GFUD01002948.1~~GFUD01002948.1.p1  ORF type:complete len:935 (+),score=127.71 GFUD01002948.1:291-3095(+)
MSLNLISSLSFLKSKLEKSKNEKPTKFSTKMDVRKLNSNTDMFAGITESDLDTSSSESEDDDSSDSSRASSPSGFNTPETNQKDEPTQDILKKCLEMLNSDISDTETLPQPDVEKETLSSDFHAVHKPEIAKLDKADSEKTPTKQMTQYPQGLLKIATPTKDFGLPTSQSSKYSDMADMTKLQPLSISLPQSSVSVPTISQSTNSTQPLAVSVHVSTNKNTSEPKSPGPPHLEPMTTTPSKPVKPVTPAPVQAIVHSQPMVHANQAKPITTTVQILPQSAQTIQQKMVNGTQQPINIQPNSFITAQNGNQIQQIILPPVQAGQQQQFILQPQQLQQQLQQQQQQPHQHHQPVQQHIQHTLPQQTLPTLSHQPTPQQPIVQIVQSGIPLQITSGPIPLLNAQGQLMGTVGGVTNHTQLLTNLQNFVMMIQPNLATTTNPAQTLNNPITIKQEPMQTPQNFLTPQMIKQQPSFISNPTPTSTINILPNNPSISNINIVPSNQTSSSINILPAPQVTGGVNIMSSNQSSANILPAQASSSNLGFVNTSSTQNGFNLVSMQPNSTNLNFMPNSSASNNVNIFQNQNPVTNYKVLPGQNSAPFSIQPNVSSSTINIMPTQTISTNQPNFNVVQTQGGQSFNIIQSQPNSSNQNFVQAQPLSSTASMMQSQSQNMNILQPQSSNNSMNILANSSQTTSSSINILPAPSSNIITLPTPTPASNILPSTSQVTTSPTVQLVQDPATGLYNLVQNNHQLPSNQIQNNVQLVNNGTNFSTPFTTSVSAPQMTTRIQPAQPLSAITESPKRSATPIMAKGSPLKVPKLLLPSLPSTKENKPAVDPPTTKFMCGVCNKYFGNQKNLRVHISEIHEGKRGQFPCDVCNKVFPRKRNMERHKNALHLKNNPVCYMCHKSVVNLEMHIKRFHKGSTEIKIKLEESAATA